jgi:hypothetical protein
MARSFEEAREGRRPWGGRIEVWNASHEHDASSGSAVSDSCANGVSEEGSSSGVGIAKCDRYDGAVVVFPSREGLDESDVF